MRETSHLIRRGLKLAHLRLIASIAEMGQVGLAANRIGMTQPAASRLLSELERIVGEPIHERTGRGIALTDQGRALAHRAKRILLEIEEAGREVAESGAGLRGHVRIGSVTGPAIEHIIPAVRAARLAMPDVTVEVDVLPSDQLAEQILDGGLDMSLSRIPADLNANLFSFYRMGGEKVALLVRKGHPLADSGAISLHDLMQFDWVMPGPGGILRRTVERKFAADGLALPRVRLATSSFLLTLAVVEQTNAIAPLALPVARQFGDDTAAPYSILPFDLEVEVEPFGMLTRFDSTLTPAANRLRQLILDRAGPTSE